MFFVRASSHGVNLWGPGSLPQSIPAHQTREPWSAAAREGTQPPGAIQEGTGTEQQQRPQPEIPPPDSPLADTSGNGRSLPRITEEVTRYAWNFGGAALGGGAVREELLPSARGRRCWLSAAAGAFAYTCCTHTQAIPLKLGIGILHPRVKTYYIDSSSIAPPPTPTTCVCLNLKHVNHACIYVKSCPTHSST